MALLRHRLHAPTKSDTRNVRARARFLSRALAFGFAVFFASAQVRAAPSPLPEYQVKAVFLFNFLQFVEWPAAAFPAPDSPLRIGVLGEDPFGPALEETVRGETVAGRPLVVHRAQRVEDLAACHLLFIGKSERSRLPQIFAQLERSPGPGLTVGEVEGFARRGGVVNFYLDGKKVRFEINPSAARRNGLKLSSQLLGLGKIVEPEPAKEAK